MSGKLMGLVYGLKLDHSQQTIALALADHAKDDGTEIYPGAEYVAWKTGYSERHVIRLLIELERMGLIVPVGPRAVGRGHKQVPDGRHGRVSEATFCICKT